MRFIWGFSIFFYSCLQQPSYEQFFGPEFTFNNIIEAIENAPKVSPYLIREKEFAYLVTDQKIENLNPQIILQKGSTVIRKEERESDYKLTVIIELRELINGDFKISKSENVFFLSKEDHRILSNLFYRQIKPEVQFFFTPFLFYSFSLEKDYVKSDRQAKTTYHNLNRRQIMFPTPRLVKERANCGGLLSEHCELGIPAVEISFDQVVWESRGGNKSSYQFIFSDYVPFFAQRLKACAESKIDYQGSRVKVLQCERVEDFTK